MSLVHSCDRELTAIEIIAFRAAHHQVKEMNELVEFVKSSIIRL